MITVFGRLDPSMIAIGAAIGLLWLIALQVLCIVLWLKLRRIFRGKGASDLEAVMAGHGAELDAIHRREHDTKETIARIRAHLDRALSQVNVIRFNPFGAGVAEQSFTVALLDSMGSGVVMTCLQSGDGSSRVYGKPVEQRISAHRLSPEEEKAIDEAMKIR
ncbi:MAG: DUF4446 family protein [Candidatus Eisenbacteria bacterium]|jgi:hypothetical protein|nr:DUF4446 family protein [Candidatus Eisenbacteria bacterium]